MEDSLGNILTSEQEAFFSASKVRDSQGRLLVCYHGTDSDFDSFDYAHIGRDNKLGLGFYFTKGTALQYNYEHTLACYINLMNPIHEEDPVFGDILAEENRLIDEGKTNNEILAAIAAKYDIDGVIGSDRGHSCIVAFSPNQIKLITNKKPTSSNSINEDVKESVYSVPVNGPSFITPEGEFVKVPGDAHRSIFDIEKYKKYKDLKDFCNDTGYIRVNDGSIVYWETYITLTIKEPTAAQYKAIEKYLDYLMMTKNTDGVSIDYLGDTMQFQSYEWDYDLPEDIIEKIKGLYKTGKLRESLIEGDRFDMFITESVYEAKNFLLNHKEDWRVFIDEHLPLYLIGRPYECTHTDMVDLARSEGYNTKIDDFDRKVVCAIYSPKNEYGWPEFPESDAYEDDYRYGYWFDNCVWYSRYIPFSNFELYKAFVSSEGKPQTGKLREELLLEKRRQELIDKSKKSDEYSKNNQGKGRNRWERRKHSQIATSVRDYNQINMDAFWKGDILEFGVKVHGETDDYVVTIIFENILRNLQAEVKGNKNKLEFKCVLRALLSSFNNDDVYVSCSCPDFKYRQAYHATRGGYNSGAPEVRPSDITNPNDTKGAGCKHINLVISNVDWMMKIASVINNYAKWCQKNMTRNYADYIFPKIYGMPYNKALQLSIFDDLDAEDSGLLPSDQKTLSTVIDKSMQGRDEKGKWIPGNEFRFQKKEPQPKSPEDNPDQLKLDLEEPKVRNGKKIKEPEIEDEKNIRISDKNIKAPDEEGEQ